MDAVTLARLYDEDTTMTTTITSAPSDPAMTEIAATYWRQTLWASIHPGLATLCSTLDEHAYLLRRIGEHLEALGPLPKGAWLDAHEQPRHALDAGELAALDLDWRTLAAEDLEALDLLPVGVWYAARHTADGIGYVCHTQGYTDGLAAFLASSEGAALQAAEGPDLRGVVPYVALYPEGHWETGTDAISQPVVLALGSGEGLARRLASDLEDALYERTWPR